jgi:alkylhydroperoxidase family enzyme
MPHIRTIPPEEAEGELKAIYDAAFLRAGRVFNVLRIQSLNPREMAASLALYQQLMLSPGKLPRRIREMLATVVSRTQDCFY